MQAISTSNQMPERKCGAVFLTDNKWSLAQHVQICCLPLIWCENVNFVLLMKALKMNEDIFRNEKC